MIRMLGNALAAELVKLRGLPVVAATVLGTVAASAALAGGVAASVRAAGTHSAGMPGPVTILGAIVPFVQLGALLLGVLIVSSEHAGRQFATTLVAVPRRGVLLSAKVLTAALAGAGTSILAVAAGLGSGAIVLASRGGPRRVDDSLWFAGGAALYLVCVCLLAAGLALLLRSLVPSLVGMLALVLILSPLLGQVPALARWLPDRAGALLYRPDSDSVLDPGTGFLILLGWILVMGSAGAVSLLRRDA